MPQANPLSVHYRITEFNCSLNRSLLPQAAMRRRGLSFRLGFLIIFILFYHTRLGGSTLDHVTSFDMKPVRAAGLTITTRRSETSTHTLFYK